MTKETNDRPRENRDILLGIERRLTRIESKQDEQCRTLKDVKKHMDRTDDALRSLPCEKHTKDTSDALARKVEWKHFLTVVVLIASFVAGAYSLAYKVDNSIDDHRLSPTPHYFSIMTDSGGDNTNGDRN